MVRFETLGFGLAEGLCGVAGKLSGRGRKNTCSRVRCMEVTQMFVVSTSGRAIGRPLQFGDTGCCAKSGFAAAGSGRFGLCGAGGRAHAVGTQLVPDMGNQQA